MRQVGKKKDYHCNESSFFTKCREFLDCWGTHRFSRNSLHTVSSAIFFLFIYLLYDISRLLCSHRKPSSFFGFCIILIITYSPTRLTLVTTLMPRFITQKNNQDLDTTTYNKQFPRIVNTIFKSNTVFCSIGMLHRRAYSHYVRWMANVTSTVGLIGTVTDIFPRN